MRFVNVLSANALTPSKAVGSTRFMMQGIFQYVSSKDTKLVLSFIVELMADSTIWVSLHMVHPIGLVIGNAYSKYLSNIPDNPFTHSISLRVICSRH